MANILQVSGAQPDKPTKFTDIYTGRFFSGIWTNRSPLRDAASTRIEEKYYGARGDAMIDGRNVEVSNRLTLIRRPGNPIFENTHTYGTATQTIDSFDEFRITKSLSDQWGTTTEQLDTMIDTVDSVSTNTAPLYALNGSTRQTVFT